MVFFGKKGGKNLMSKCHMATLCLLAASDGRRAEHKLGVNPKP